MISKQLSENLNILMAKARVNSSELARLIGLPATTIKRIRNNEQANPTVATLVPIANYFSVSIGDLLGYEAETKATSPNEFTFVVEDNDLEVFPCKSILTVNTQLQPASGDYVIVSRSQGVSSLKKYIVETDQVYLKSLVSGLGIAPLTPEYQILGVVVEYRVELKKQKK